MRRLTLTKLENPEFSYQEALVSMLRRPRKQGGGIDYKEMQEVLPIIEKIEAGADNEEILLEESEWKELCERAKVFPFVQNRREFLDFVEHILGAEQYTPTLESVSH